MRKSFLRKVRTPSPSKILERILNADEINGPALPYAAIEAAATSLQTQQYEETKKSLIESLETLEKSTAGLSPGQLTTSLNKADNFLDFAPIIANIKEAKRATGETDFPEVDLLLEFIVYETKKIEKDDDTYISDAAFRNEMAGPDTGSCLNQIQGELADTDNELSHEEKAIFISLVNVLTDGLSATEKYMRQEERDLSETLNTQLTTLNNGYDEKKPAVNEERKQYNEKIQRYNQKIDSSETAIPGESIEDYNKKVRDYNNDASHKEKKGAKVKELPEIKIKDLSNDAAKLDTDNHKQVAQFISRIKAIEMCANPEKGSNPSSDTIPSLLNLLVIKSKQKFDRNNAHRVNKNDSPREKQDKVKKFNAIFKKEMGIRFDEIGKELTALNPKLNLKGNARKFGHYVQRLIDIDTVAAEMTAEFDYGKTQILDQIANALSALEKAGNPKDAYGAEIEALQLQLDAKNPHEKDTEEYDAFKKATEYKLAQEIRNQHPMPENKAALNAYEDDYVPPELEDDDENSLAKLIKKIATVTVQQQKVQTTLDRAQDASFPEESPEKKLEKCRQGKINALRNIHSELTGVENPSPKILYYFQQSINKVNRAYRYKVSEIHEEEKTRTSLDSTSVPLNTLRGRFATESARLPVPKIGNTEHNTLIRLRDNTIKVNELLEQLEDMEATLASNPALAESMQPKIDSTISKLKNPLEEIAKITRSAHNIMGSLLASIPNIEEFTDKASKLYDGLYRKGFSEKFKIPGIFKFHPAYKYLRKNYNPGVQKVKYSEPEYEGNNGAYTTYYYLKGSNGKWGERIKLELTGNVLTDNNGNSLKDKNNNDISITDENRAVKFTKGEFINLYAEFCRKRGIKPDGMKQLSPTKFRIQWKNEGHKKEWIDFLKGNHKQKLINKANNPDPKVEHTAKAVMKQNGISTAGMSVERPDEEHLDPTGMGLIC